ncbi:class I SAM-dependent methyltransferase [Rhodovulum sulfidophilum]|uniref:class I SAM-dependent methyltransferase n=1 Tax=Rhodovulum sulfidophilum TaxID=35806 RepID=UPI0009D65E30|nr:class I SAM-dependent methyltransferase [Rhodovulum sulfidophilum]
MNDGTMIAPYLRVVPENRSALRFFTICARNFLPGAQILCDSVRRAHPGAVFTVYLCDRDMGYDAEALGMDIEPLEALGIPALERMIRTYNITELCTAIKPYCFLREFARGPEAEAGAEAAEQSPHVVYLDPDIELFSPLVEVAEALDAGASAVLTPHVLKPAERAEFADDHFLRYGIYNLGFIALRVTEAVADVVRWWARRMVDQCIIDLPRGIFVDQKWMDLLPAFLDGVHVLRHPGYNVAYWNLHERRIHGPDTALQCNGQPLRFVHYSGIILEDVEQLSRHSGMFYVSNSFGYGPLVRRYRARLTAPENRRLRQLPYAFFWNGAGDSNAHTPGGGGAPAWRRPDSFLFARQAFSLEQYLGYLTAEAREIESQRATEAALTPRGRREAFEFTCYCAVCGGRHPMVTSFMYSCATDGEGNPIPNWREHIACRSCGLPNRVRASVHLFLQEFDPAPDSRIYITEQKTALYTLLSGRFSRLTGSEYFGNRVPKGAMFDGVRNENFEALSFQSESFDYLLSFDVLEHVPHPERAFAEAFRVLEPGGSLIFSVPAHLDRYPSTIRAELAPDGQIVHHLPAEIHGNPVDEKGGALCFRHFGWDVMDMLREAGFRRPFLYHYWSREFGYFGPGQALFVAEKPR